MYIHIKNLLPYPDVEAIVDEGGICSGVVSVQNAKTVVMNCFIGLNIDGGLLVPLPTKCK